MKNGFCRRATLLKKFKYEIYNVYLGHGRWKMTEDCRRQPYGTLWLYRNQAYRAQVGTNVFGRRKTTYLTQLCFLICLLVPTALCCLGQGNRNLPFLSSPTLLREVSFKQNKGRVVFPSQLPSQLFTSFFPFAKLPTSEPWTREQWN